MKKGYRVLAMLGLGGVWACGGGLASPGASTSETLWTDTGAKSCQAVTDCRFPTPQYCEQCSDGTTVCAHWACVQSACQLEVCPHP
jgi:hypothetical protein